MQAGGVQAGVQEAETEVGRCRHGGGIGCAEALDVGASKLAETSMTWRRGLTHGFRRKRGRGDDLLLGEHREDERAVWAKTTLFFFFLVNEVRVVYI